MDAANVRIEAGVVEAIARRVVELLRAEELATQTPRYVDAATLAEDLEVERDWVYLHKEELGAIRLGGPRGRLRFDRQFAKERLRERDTDRARTPSAVKSRKSPRRGKVKSPERQRRASGRTPAQRLSDNRRDGSPNDEA